MRALALTLFFALAGCASTSNGVETASNSDSGFLINIPSLNGPPTQNHSCSEQKKACGCPGMQQCCTGADGRQCCTPGDCSCNQVTFKSDGCSCHLHDAK